MPRSPEGGGPDPRLRRARPDDAEAVRAVVHAAYGAYGDLLGRTPYPMQVDQAASIRDHEVWVLEDGERVVGVIDLIPRDDHLWVDNVAIHPDGQGRGHGRRLLAHAETRARTHGLPAMGLLTNERYVANIAMYQRYGYRETHREPRDGTDLVHFRKAIPGD
jgi:ribosomal protein S18 acetylase RimI-like enzyme